MVLGEANTWSDVGRHKSPSADCPLKQVWDESDLGDCIRLTGFVS